MALKDRMKQKSAIIAAVYGRKQVVLAVHPDDESVARDEGVLAAADELGIPWVKTRAVESGVWELTTREAIGDSDV